MWSSFWDCMRWWDSAWSSNAWEGAMPWLMFLPMLWPLLVIGTIIFVVALLIREGRTPAKRRDPTSLAPFEILRERFARGEIDQAEYEEKRRVISQG
jgi:putative membrane protein